MKTGNLALRKFQIAVVCAISLFAAAILFAQSASKRKAGNEKPATTSKLDMKQIQMVFENRMQQRRPTRAPVQGVLWTAEPRTIFTHSRT